MCLINKKMEENKKAEICRKAGYHSWGVSGGRIDSVGETFEDMDMEATCGVCGMVATGNLTWEE